LSRTNSTYQASPQNFFPFSYGKTIGESAPDDFLYVKENHLGNVLSVVSDRKLGVDNVNNTTGVAPPDGLVDYYLADVVSTTDYYAFGSPMPGRQFNSNSYRYGFGNHEKDDEISGSGNAYDFEGYGYDPRTLRRKGPDPDASRYPQQSPYSTFNGNPMIFVDHTGKGAEYFVLNNTIYISAKIYLYPADKSTVTTAQIQQAIDGMNFNSKTLVSEQGKQPYNVQINIDVQVVTKEQAQKQFEGNTKSSTNFFEVRETLPAMSNSEVEIGEGAAGDNTKINPGYKGSGLNISVLGLDKVSENPGVILHAWGHTVFGNNYGFENDKTKSDFSHPPSGAGDVGFMNKRPIAGIDIDALSQATKGKLNFDKNGKLNNQDKSLVGAKASSLITNEQATTINK